ncbi:helix-turn-helix domain-containing protein [Streptomyces sp. NPDC050147]|uniref:helix-turn-helix domain-containing protein n=1 Tax=Streptomyces sp. NPDC050147 TaxID=3155513 RepID=UPI00343C28FB
MALRSGRRSRRTRRARSASAFGDVISASAAMHVHPNTFRYRLKRLSKVSGIDVPTRLTSSLVDVSC